MLDSLNSKYFLITDLRMNLISISGISLGIFFFLLFFQPLVPQNPDFNNKLLILAGFGCITLILLGLLRIILPSVFTKIFDPNYWTYKKELIIHLLFLAFNSVAFVFFARYVGKTEITFFKTILIVIISFSAIIIQGTINEHQFLKMKIEKLTQLVVPEEEETIPEETAEIEFESENKSEYFKLFPEQIILIKSANNYIEIIYKEEGKTNHRLIRNTLKNTEELLSKYRSLIRCHRSCIVNKNFIQKVIKGTFGLKFKLFDYDQEIYVSRQYILSVKQALKNCR